MTFLRQLYYKRKRKCERTASFMSIHLKRCMRCQCTWRDGCWKPLWAQEAHTHKENRACMQKKKKNRISHSVWNASCMWGSLCCCYTILNHNIRRNEVYYMYALYLFPYRRLIDGVLLAQIQNAHTDCSGEEHLYFFKCSVKTVVYDTYISKYMHI